MAYFNYHAKAKNLIKTGHCLKAVLERYKDICPALVLYFDNYRPMPIRVHRFDEYFALLKCYGVTPEFLQTPTV